MKNQDKVCWVLKVNLNIANEEDVITVEYWLTRISTTRIKNCLKSLRIRSLSGTYFPAFGLNTRRYSVSLRIQFKCRKIRTTKTPNRNNCTSDGGRTHTTSKMNSFATIVNDWNLLIIVTKLSILDVCVYTGYTSSLWASR